MPSLLSSKRRELIFVTLVSALALVPLGLIWRKSLVSRPPVVQSKVADWTPVITGDATGGTTDSAALSPNVKFIARMELSPSEVGITPAPNALSTIADELVIRSAGNGKELFRSATSGQFVSWIAGTSAFIALSGNDVTLFTPATRAPGAAAPTQPWSETPISFGDGGGGISQESGANGSTIQFLQGGMVAFSPGGRYAVKAAWSRQGDDIIWQAADLMKSKISPIIKAGHDFGETDSNKVPANFRICVAPATLATGAWPLVVLVQSNKPNAAATPTPLPTTRPAPTPTFTPQQNAFVDKEAREIAEIQVLVDSVLGVDGADAAVTDEAEVAHIEAEVKRRNQQLRKERALLFPRPRPMPTSTTESESRTQGQPFGIECFDLSQHSRLWSAQVEMKSDSFAPESAFSPDGRALVVWGLAQINGTGKSAYTNDTGLEIRDPLSGAVRARPRLMGFGKYFNMPNQSQIQFYETPGAGSAPPTSMMVLEDAFAPEEKSLNGKPAFLIQDVALRFFDMASARETGHLRVKSELAKVGDSLVDSQFRCSQSGLWWLVGGGDFAVLRRSELGQETLSPFPTPMPDK